MFDARSEAHALLDSIPANSTSDVVVAAICARFERINSRADFRALARPLLDIAEASLLLGLSDLGLSIARGVRRATRQAAQRWGRIGSYSEQAAAAAQAFRRFVSPG